MKHKGSTSDFSRLRDLELHASFAAQLKNPDIRDNKSLYTGTVKTGCSRFWVSEERASEIVAGMLKGKKISNMLDEKRRMYEEIKHRVDKMRKVNPQQSLYKTVEQVVWEPAPEFYLSPESARKIIRRILLERRERREA